MPTLAITKNYSANNVLTAAHLNSLSSSIETFINSTKLDGDNIQISAIANDVGSAMTSTGANAVLNSATYAGAIYAGKVKGTTTNDDATATHLGEMISSAVSVATNVATTATFQNITTLSLSAGDWDVSGNVEFLLNGATCLSVRAALSLYANNTTTDHVDGSNVIGALPPSSDSRSSISIPRFRVSAAGATTLYFKALATFSAGNPQYVGYVSARRVR